MEPFEKELSQLEPRVAPAEWKQSILGDVVKPPEVNSEWDWCEVFYIPRSLQWGHHPDSERGDSPY